MTFPPDAQPRTIAVPGAGTQTLSFTLPEGVVLKLESVIATIDGGAATPTPELVLTAPGGAVIAAKRQASAVEAGAGNRATWALRLADEAGATVVPTFGACVRQSANQSIPSGVFTQLTFDTVLWDTAGMASGASFTSLDVTADGLYWVWAQIQHFTSAGDNFGFTDILSDTDNVALTNAQHGGRAVDSGVAAVITIVPIVGYIAVQAGNGLRVRVQHNRGLNRNVRCTFGAVRVGSFVP